MPRKAQRKCEYCRRPLHVTMRPDARYCTSTCRVRAWRENRTSNAGAGEDRTLGLAPLRGPSEDQRVLLAAVAIAASELTRTAVRHIREFASRDFNQWKHCVAWAKEFLRALPQLA